MSSYAIQVKILLYFDWIAQSMSKKSGVLSYIAFLSNGELIFWLFVWKYSMAKKNSGVLSYWLFCLMAKKIMAFSHMAKLKSGF